MKDKLAELAHLEHLFKEKISESERAKMMGRIVSRIICSLTKYLIKDAGYGVAATIIQREIKELGKENARKYMEMFEIKERNLENTSRILKIAAMILGFKLGVIGNETIVQECPHGTEAKNIKEPFFCNICLEYNNGIIEGILGKDFVIERTKWIFDGDDYCEFKIRKR